MDNNTEVKSLVGATAEEVADFIFDVLDSKKGKNVKKIKVGEKTVIADYFVIANGNSSTHVRSLADEVEFKMGEAGIKPLHSDAGDGKSWIVLDYANVIVHVFDREAREFYNLDRLYTEFE